MSYEDATFGARCASCGEPLIPTQAFCPKCGAQNPHRRIVCAGCGSELDATHDFCPECGRKVDVPVDAGVNAAIAAFNESVTSKKKHPKKLIAIILVSVLLLGSIGGIVANRVIAAQKKKQAIESYISTAESFYKDCASTGELLEDIGNDIQSAWSMYVTYSYPAYNGKRLYSPNDAVSAAHDKNNNNILVVKMLQTSIQKKYNMLLEVPDEKNETLSDLRDAVKRTYREYLEFFDNIISPNGTFSTWKSNFHSSDTNLANALKELSSLV